MNFVTPRHHDTYPEIQGSDHRGHVVLVTGASKGIGRSSALAFAKAGAEAVVIAARNDLADLQAEMAKLSATRVLRLALDVTDEASVAEAAKNVERELGRVDILINNAGYLENWVPVAESKPAEWWRTWEVNIKGVYLVTRAILPLLLRGEPKTIVNVSSAGAHRTESGASAYQTTKFALLRFTEFLSVEYGPRGLIAFAVHPGGVPTELALGMPDHMHRVLVDTPELAADTLAWLTAQRREWLSGRYVSVNWDQLEVEARKDEIVEQDKLKMRMTF